MKKSRKLFVKYLLLLNNVIFQYIIRIYLTNYVQYTLNCIYYTLNCIVHIIFIADVFYF